RLLHRVDDGELVEQVGLVQVDLVSEVVNPLECLGASPADDAVDLVALGEQQLGEVAAVLAGDAGNQSPLHDLRPEGNPSHRELSWRPAGSRGADDWRCYT